MFFNCILIIFCLNTEIYSFDIEIYHILNNKKTEYFNYSDIGINNKILLPISKEEQFIQNIYKYVSSENKDHIIPTSIVISKTILESGWGTSYSYKKKNNPLGLKYYSKGIKKSKKFNSLQESFEYYFSVIEKLDYYEGIVKKTKNGVNVFEILNDKGFLIYSGNDKNYTKKLIQIINKYNLTRFDTI